MYKIAYLIPYFGKLPEGFKLWLLTCKTNSTIDWIIFTDDKTSYDYPNNVKVCYTTFNDFKKRIQSHFDFPIIIDRPWKLCEFRPAYGEIFHKELVGYDFWGHCDMDLIWGDIRKFITNDILEKYEKIGFQGHSTLYKNCSEVNLRYKTIIPGKIDYRKIFSSKEGHCFDENGICEIYDYLQISYYRETNFAHLDRFNTSFFLGHMPISEDYKNKRQLFVWKKGKVLRKYLFNRQIHQEEFMYLHFFSRPISYKEKTYNLTDQYVIYPDIVKNLNKEVDRSYIKCYGKCSSIRFYCKVAYFYRKKLTLKKIVNSFIIKYKRLKNRENSKLATKSSKID